MRGITGTPTLADELDPTVVDDDDVGWIPVAVHIEPIIETPAVGGVDDRLRKLGVLDVRRNMDTLRFHPRHFLTRLHFSRRQVSLLWVVRRHRCNLAIVDVG